MNICSILSNRYKSTAWRTLSNNPIHPLWYLEAQRDLSNQPKTSFTTSPLTYPMAEAFLPKTIKDESPNKWHY